MADLPYMRFFPADYLRDTEILSLSAQGGWMRMLCGMWHPSRRGVLSLRLQAMARLLHASEQTTKSIIDEIGECEVGVVEWSDGGDRVTITCRRMVRDWETLSEERSELSDKRSEAARARWEKHRQSTGNAGGKQEVCTSNASAQQVHSKCNAIPEARSQNGIEREKTRERCTIDQAVAFGNTIGITKAACEIWWHTRNAAGWVKPTVGGGVQQIHNWQSDMAASKSWAEREASTDKGRNNNHREAKAAREFPEPQHQTTPLPRA